LRAENGARRLLPKHPAGSGYANTYTYSNPDSDRYSNSYIYADAYTYGNGNTDCDGDSYSHVYFDTETFADAESCANATASPYPAIAPVAYPYENETHYSICLR
jgi:hypothetical protein